MDCALTRVNLTQTLLAPAGPILKGEARRYQLMPLVFLQHVTHSRYEHNPGFEKGEVVQRGRGGLYLNEFSRIFLVMPHQRA